MNRWSWHWTRVLLLALLLAVGVSLSFVQGSLMTAEMAVATDGAHHPSDCDGCAAGDQKGADAGTCVSVCGSAAQGLMSGELLTLPATSRTAFQAAHLLLSGQTNSPDHGPPKILTFG